MSPDYPKPVILKDGREVELRVLGPSDGESVADFFDGLSDSDRWFFQKNVDPKAEIDFWVNRDEPASLSIGAVFEGRLVGLGSLRRQGYGSTSHLGTLQVIVDEAFRQKRLGTWIMLDLIAAAVGFGLDRLVIELVGGKEDAAIRGAKRLDFFQRATVPNFARDQRGNEYDLVIMVKRLHHGWDDF